MTDLGVYAPLSAKVAALTADDDLTFTSEDFPAALEDYASFGGLILDHGCPRFCSHAEGGGGDRPFEVVDRAEGFEAYAEPEGFRRVGIWLMHFLLSGRDWAGLRLTHPTGRVAHLYASLDLPYPRNHYLRTTGPERAVSFNYWPREVWRQPFTNLRMSPEFRVEKKDRPLFAYGWSQDAYNCQFDVDQADQVIFHATSEGIAALASLLMDIAHPTLGLGEVSIEVPTIGFAGTRQRSIEARFWLPNSFSFDCDTLDGLILPPTRAETHRMTKANMEAYRKANSDKII